jgi:4-amino-4-deoxy-L-arabinose transferase-like glycosyltransferase
VDNALAKLRRTGHTGQEVEVHISLETGLFCLLLGLIFLVRVNHLGYNTLFLDEALYVNAGRDILAGFANWHFILSVYGGSPLYPLMAGLADLFGGVGGARLLSAILSTLTAACVFGTTRRLFGHSAALWAMLIFGLTGASISVGQMAVYDVGCLFFLSFAGYCLTLAPWKHGWRERACLLGAAISFSVATLSKYVGIFYLPALTLIAAALYVVDRRTRRLGAVVAYLWIPAGLILGTYALATLPLLRQAISMGVEHVARWAVLRVITDEIGLVIPIATAGAALLASSAFRAARADEAPVVRALSGWLRGRKIPLALAFLSLGGMLGSFLLSPAYQVLDGNIRSVWKHTVASLIFLSPFAGFAIARVIGHFHSSTLRTRALGAALMALALYGAANYGLDRNWGFQNSWPNIGNAVAYLQARGLSPDSRVLAEGGASYLYYFHFGPAERDGVSDTFYLEYKGLTGAEAMMAAIRDHYFDFVVLDDNFTPALNRLLEAALAQAGYGISFQELQTLTIGDRLVRVYEPGLGDGRGER